jgi:hypothetical protein
MTQLEGEAATPATVSWQGVDRAQGGGASNTRSLHNPGLSAPYIHTMASPPPVEDQARLLEDALAVVRQQTLLMRRCLETPGKLMDALKCRCAQKTHL